MYPVWVWQVLALAGIIWLLGLTFLSLRQERFLRSLFPKSGTRDIRKKFEEVAGSVAQLDGKLLDIIKRLDLIEKEDLKHIQKVKLIRYNPYEDTGGDQSFTVSLLDKEGSGFVITSLHTRSGTRVFAKPVHKGGGGKYQFSKEEQEVIKQAV